VDVALPIALLVLSLGFVILEVFIPSFGLLAVCSAACLVACLVLGFLESTVLGWSLLSAALVGTPTLLIFAFKLFPKTPLGKHMILSRRKRGPDAMPDRRGEDLVGKVGTSSSPLRPSGVADFAGRRVDVVTRGEMIAPGTAVRVVESRGNRIVVRAANEPPNPQDEEERLR